MQIRVRHPKDVDESAGNDADGDVLMAANALAEEDFVVVTPGEVISTDTGAFLRGHGTFLSQHQLIASVAGVVEKVNQLISVRPLVSRYIGEVGDIVVGRIAEVGAKRWKVDVNGQQHAVLMLSAVNLPGGAQRKRTHEDQLQMRQFFNENDLISAEIQEVRYDGSLALHTRSLKYGQLVNGQFAAVLPGLVKRMKQHFVTLETLGIEIILGNNGFLWITRSLRNLQQQLGLPVDDPATASSSSVTMSMETRTEILTKQRQLHATTPMNMEDRRRIALVYRSVSLLNNRFQLISPESILAVVAQLEQQQQQQVQPFHQR